MPLWAGIQKFHCVTTQTAVKKVEDSCAETSEHQKEPLFSDAQAILFSQPR